ncbi:FAD-binding oxidoreductase [Aurantimonas sp. C2-5-R2]|uniref:FAD-binding oxidoreductase n=1 Tax=Aurantimonas sp. C2-5-R2 TaxID=3113713 RepID=UPI002F93111E
MMNINDEALTALRSELGSGAVSTAGDDLDVHAGDWWPVIAKWSDEEKRAHRPACVVRPRDEEAISAAVRIAGRFGLAVIPYGAGSGVTGGVVSSSGAIVIDLRAMSDLLDVDEENFTVTVDPGWIGGDLEQALNLRGFTLGHYPQSLHLASVGGLVSTKSTGTFSSKYGGIEDLILGLRVVLSDGEVADFRPVPRSATGPGLSQLFIGAEGTLGVISRATLRMFPIAETRLFSGYAFPDLNAGIRAVREAFASHVRPAVLRLYDGIEAQGLYGRIGLRESRPLLIGGHEGIAVLAEAEQNVFRKIAEQHGAEFLGDEIGWAWEAHRFDASWLVEGNGAATRMADAIEVAAPWSLQLAVYEAVMQDIAPLCSRAMGHFSHFYSTGGAIYFIFFVEGKNPDDTRQRYEEVWNLVMRRVLALGGSISHHHGIGAVRSPFLKEELGTAHDVLVRVKRALDPENLMNPGKLGLDTPQSASQRMVVS